MNSQKVGFALFLTVLIAMVLGFIGWLMNIVKLIQADAFTGLEVGRAIGIFLAPIGAILGWF